MAVLLRMARQLQPGKTRKNPLNVQKLRFVMGFVPGVPGRKWVVPGAYRGQNFSITTMGYALFSDLSPVSPVEMTTPRRNSPKVALFVEWLMHLFGRLWRDYGAGAAGASLLLLLPSTRRCPPDPARVLLLLPGVPDPAPTWRRVTHRFSLEGSRAGNSCRVVGLLSDRP